MLVDEAHALGVLGDDGAGTVSHFGLHDQVDLILATFSKSLASIGGVVAGPESVIHYLRHHSRALIFTASMPPSSVAGALAALDILQDEPERRVRLWENTNRMADGLRSLGFDIGATHTPVIPVVVGDPIRAMSMWRALFDDGVFTHPIVPPAVPEHACRLRVSLSAEHTSEQIERVLSAFERVGHVMAVHVVGELKVALVCDWYHPRVGGIELHLQDLAATLVAARHDVVVITPTPGDDRVDGIRVRRISAPRAPRFGFLVTPAGVRAVGDALADERVDVAHCHVSIVSPAAMGGAAQVGAARSSDGRHVPLSRTADASARSRRPSNAAAPRHGPRASRR